MIRREIWRRESFKPGSFEWGGRLSSSDRKNIFGPVRAECYSRWARGFAFMESCLALPFTYTMAHPTVTVRDILLFYNIDRVVYDKFVNGGMEPGIARNAVAIFTCLEECGMDLVAQIAPITDPTRISLLIAEANTVLYHIRPNNYPIHYSEIPLITSMAKNCLDICLNSYKDLIVKGVADILNGVGRFVFDDHMYELLRAYETKKAVMPVVPPEPELATLYDFAATAPLIREDARSAFLTFAKDRPREGDILEYFKRWGSADCIDKLIMSGPGPGPGTSTMYGKMVFKSDTYISLLLNGSKQPVQYFINGKPIWVQKYVKRVRVN